MIPKVTPFEVYQKYLSLKQHFNKVDYDYFKFNLALWVHGPRQELSTSCDDEGLAAHGQDNTFGTSRAG